MKKIGGNWHRVVVWKKYVVGYVAGGFIFVDQNTLKESEYIPFVGFASLEVVDEELYTLDRQGRCFKFVEEDNRLGLIEQINVTKVDKNKDKILEKLPNLVEDPRALDWDNHVIAVAYKQQGIEFYTHKGEKVVHFDFPGYSFIDDICLAGSKLYIADVFGLRILDISNLDKPILNDTLVCKGWPKDIAVQDEFVYVADVLGLKIYDKSQDFKLIGRFESNRNRIAKVIVEGSFAYASCEAVGLKVIDITNPENPKLVSGIVLSSGVWDSCVYGDYVYLAAYTQGLIKVNKKNIKSMKCQTQYKNCKEVIGVCARDRAVFAACSYEGFKVFDHDLKLLYSYEDIIDRCWTVLEHDNMLYAACGADGVIIFDAEDLHEIKLVGTIETVQARDLMIDDGQLFIADGRNGVLVYNLWDKALKKQISQIPTSAFTRGVMVEKGFIYKADGDGGVEIYARN
ncbi:MAG: hypothetical protein APF76_10945 [Desulfitibacter sp. BRH_c19]|nr:MAG: hypothetical protein APF76_10945 [Desulfitibacter sp. BRH_c19]